MQREFASYVVDLLHAGEDIESYVHGYSEESYVLDSKTQAAVERKFEIMGEALSQARRMYPEEVSGLGKVQPIIDFRNFLAHEYHKTHAPNVWTIVHVDLPEMMVVIRRLIGELNLYE